MRIILKVPAESVQRLIAGETITVHHQHDEISLTFDPVSVSLLRHYVEEAERKQREAENPASEEPTLS
ncbi:MAG: hypothetical protein ACRD3D_13085 [Terriglobia bacterium]